MARLLNIGLFVVGLLCVAVAGYDGYDPFGDLISRVTLSMEQVLDQEVPPTNVSLSCVNASKQYLENLRRRETWALKSKCTGFRLRVGPELLMIDAGISSGVRWVHWVLHR